MLKFYPFPLFLLSHMSCQVDSAYFQLSQYVDKASSSWREISSPKPCPSQTHPSRLRVFSSEQASRTRTQLALEDSCIPYESAHLRLLAPHQLCPPGLQDQQQADTSPVSPRLRCALFRWLCLPGSRTSQGSRGSLCAAKYV